MKLAWPRAATLETLGTIVVKTLKDEAEFLTKYESNWGNYGLPGRRELHIVSAIAHQLRARYRVRSVLEDDYVLGPRDENYGRCDLAVQLDPSDRTGSWAWLEFKTMPWTDAIDKLGGKGGVHDDLDKLDRAARGSSQNLPQAIAVVGYGRDADEPNLERRFHHLAGQHRLDLWPLRLGPSGVVRFELPQVAHDPDPYTHCIVGFWARTKYRVKMSEHGCNRECGSIRAARRRFESVKLASARASRARG